jgi:hypothetical protein
MLDKRSVQTIILTLKDGSRIRYHGPTQVTLETMVKTTIVDIKFTEGKPLPEGMTWEDYPEEKDE